MNRLKISEEHKLIRQALMKFTQEVWGRASKTAKDYTESMERFLPRFMEEYMNIYVYSIYDVHDLEFLQNIHDQIKNKQEWKEYNARKHGCTFTSGLKCYIEFYQSDYYPFKRYNNVAQVPVSVEYTSVHVEGKVYESHSVGFERNQKAREECLKYYGCKCSVCGFDFEKEYGELGRGFIEVHHIVPLSTIRDEYVVDPIRDLRPLCSNCHSMVHRREPMAKLEDLTCKSMIEEYTMNHLYEELEEFLNIYYKEANSMNLDDFLSILLFRIFNKNLLKTRRDPKINCLLKDFEEHCLKNEDFQNVPSEFFLLIIKEWLETLDFRKKKTYVYTLGIFNEIKDDGSLVYLCKDSVVDTLEVDDDEDEDEEMDELQDDEPRHYSISEQIVLKFQKNIIEKYIDKSYGKSLVNLDKLMICLGEILKSYDKSIIEHEVLLIGYLEIFSEILYQENWATKISDICKDMIDNKKKASYLFVAIQSIKLHCEYINIIPNTDDSVLVVTINNLDDLFASVSDFESCKEQENSVKEELVEMCNAELREATIVNQSEGGKVDEECPVEKQAKIYEKLILEEFQNKIVEALEGNKEKHFKYADVVQLLAGIIRPYVKSYSIECFSELSKFYESFRKALDSENWKNQINECVMNMSILLKRETLPHVRHFSSCMSYFINDGLSVYVKLRDDYNNVFYQIEKEDKSQEKDLEEIKIEEQNSEWKENRNEIKYLQDEVYDENEDDELIETEVFDGKEEIEETKENLVKIVDGSKMFSKDLFSSRPFITHFSNIVFEDELNKFWQKIFPEGEPNPPFWRHRMSQDNYDFLKDKLKACIKENRRNTIKNHSLKLAFCISEWYKREFEGNDSNVFSELGLKRTDTKKIWETLKAPLYKMNDTIRWLDSIYVLGGLPLKYCQTDYTDIVDRLGELKSEGTTEWIGEELSLNNAVVEKSLNDSNGSLHWFVEEILSGEYPFAKTDNNLSLFSSFKGLVDNGDDRLEASFELIREYYINEEYGIYREFRVRLKNLLKKRYISYEQIRPYNIREDMSSFEIRFRFENKENFSYSKKYKLYFTNDYCGHFVGYGTANEIIIDDIPIYELGKFTIEISDGIISLWKNPVSFDSFVQLYSDGSGVWTDKQTSLSNQTAVLYDDCVFKEVEGSIKLPLSDGNEGDKLLCWKDIEEQVELVKSLNGEVVKLKNDCTDYFLDFVRLDAVIDYININEVKVCTSDGEKTMPLMIGKQSLKVYTIDEDGERSIAEDYVMKYRLPNEQRYHEWDNDAPLPQGVLYLKCGNVRQEVYYLPLRENSVVARDCDRHSIVWDNHIQILEREHVYKEEVAPFNLDKRITIEYKLGNSDCYAVIPIYRPYSGVLLYKDNELVRIYRNSEKVELPFILQQKYHIVSYPNGHKPTIMWLGDFNVSDNQLGKITFYKWKEIEISKIETIINTLADKEAYQFYYWSKKTSDSPVLISMFYENRFLIDRSKFKRDEGIIFQSLKDYKPICYYKPIDFNRISNTEIDYDFMMRCFDISCEHNIYFSVFDELNDLKTPEFLTSFIRKLYDRDSELNDMNLIRLANELNYIWAFLKRCFWISSAKVRENDGFEKEVVGLLRKEAYLLKPDDEYSAKLFCNDYFKHSFIIGKNNPKWRIRESCTEASIVKLISKDYPNAFPDEKVFRYFKDTEKPYMQLFNYMKNKGIIR